MATQCIITDTQPLANMLTKRHSQADMTHLGLASKDTQINSENTYKSIKIMLWYATNVLLIMNPLLFLQVVN